MRKIALLLVLASSAMHAQIVGAAMPYTKIQFLDNNGVPLPGGKLCTYAAGTSTPQATYTTFSNTTANTNPVILDSAGRATVSLGPNPYKFILLSAGTDTTCSTGTTIWTQDNVTDYGLLLAKNLASGGGAGIIGFEQPQAGAVQTTVQNVLGRIAITGEEFGVNCSSPISAQVDQWANLQAGLTAAGTAYQIANTVLNVPSLGYDFIAPSGNCFTSQQLVVPIGVHFKGHGTLSTQIAVTSAFPVNTAVVYLQGGTGDTSPAFDTRVEELAIACGYNESDAPISGAIGIQSAQAEELSGADRVNIAGCHIGISLSGFGTQNSQWQNIQVSSWPTGWGGADNPVCISMANTTGITIGPGKITCTGGGGESTTVAGGAIQLLNVGGSVANVHCEEWTACIAENESSLFLSSIDCVQNCGPAVVQLQKTTGNSYDVNAGRIEGQFGVTAGIQDLTQAVSFTCTTNATATCTTASTTGLVVGQTVTGSGIPCCGTTIQSFVSNTSVTLTASATTSVVNNALVAGLPPCGAGTLYTCDLYVASENNGTVYGVITDDPAVTAYISKLKTDTLGATTSLYWGYNSGAGSGVNSTLYQGGIFNCGDTYDCYLNTGSQGIQIQNSKQANAGTPAGGGTIIWGNTNGGGTANPGLGGIGFGISKMGGSSPTAETTTPGYMTNTTNGIEFYVDSPNTAGNPTVGSTYTPTGALIVGPTVAYVNLSTTNGTVQYCTNCTVTSSSSNVCTSGGGGTFAFRVNGSWHCI
jgi:hypothetical protein